jgi:predicted esterase
MHGTVIERAIAVTTHGRYVAHVPAGRGPWPLLIGFHGYAEAAERQLERLDAIPGADAWIRASVQGLHRFYRGRGSEVVASWMTRQDRELAIADNAAYVSAVVDDIARTSELTRIVFAGFSQGVAMAFRAAVRSSRAVAGVIALGGDVPPELDARSLGRIPAALVGRGTSDAGYGQHTFTRDVERLRAAGVRVDAATFDGAHEWTPPFSRAAAEFLIAAGR